MPNTSYKLSIPVPRSHPDYMKYYRKARAEQMHENGKKWAEENKEKKRQQWREWYKRNPKTHLANTKAYLNAKHDRMPDWVDKKAIEKIYEDCPEGYHVDHIIPLRGKNISGLHVPWNLQYLTAEENMRKGNR